ncbi:MAG: DUF4126 domain-containing protein [Chloroflexi bacterium]|nr:DUF4126 domain-containing protein [Chloroflexota bacterium]
MALLGTTFGLSFVSGIRLYATVFGVGLAIRMGWLHLKPELQNLSILANEWVIVIAGILFLIEFFADKIPYIDTAWDIINALIRPIGGVWLASQALGEVNPVLMVIAVLLAGTVTVSSVSAKSFTRIASNIHPEPFTNIGLSIFEDIFSIFMLWLSFTAPVLVFIIVIVLTVFFIWLIPKAVRWTIKGLRSIGVWIRKKFSGIAGKPT